MITSTLTESENQIIESIVSRYSSSPVTPELRRKISHEVSQAIGKSLLVEIVGNGAVITSSDESLLLG